MASNDSKSSLGGSGMRAAGWAAVVLAAVAAAGLLAAPSLRLIWIVLPVFAVCAVPQAFVAVRLLDRRERERRGR